MGIPPLDNLLTTHYIIIIIDIATGVLSQETLASVLVSMEIFIVNGYNAYNFENGDLFLRI